MGYGSKTSFCLQKHFNDATEAARNSGFETKKPTTILKYYTPMVIVILLLYVLVKVSALWQHDLWCKNLPQLATFYFPECLATFILIYKLAALSALLRSLKNRYAFVVDTITELRNCEKHLADCYKMMKIKKLEKIIRCLYFLMRSVSEFYGFYFFICVIVTVLGCLYSVAFVLSYRKVGQIRYEQLYHLFVDCSMLLVSFPECIRQLW